MKGRAHRMLVIRSAGIGDVAMSVHAVRALRETYPDLGIVVATRAKMFPLFNGIDNLDFINVGSVRDLVAEAVYRDVDMVADLRNEIRGKLVRWFLRLCGRKVAHYKAGRISRFPLLRRWNRNLHPLRNNLLRFCDVFAELGYPVSLPENPVVRARPVPEVFGEKTGAWAGVAPFTSGSVKDYPLDQCSRLVELMCGKYDKVFVFSGPGAELEYAESLCSEFPGKVVRVFGKTDLAGEAALMSNLDAVVVMDSSAMHIASSVTDRYVALWGGTHPFLGYSPLWADYEKNFLQTDIACRPCSVYGEGRCLRGDHLCMKMLTPELVMKKIDDSFP